MGWPKSLIQLGTGLFTGFVSGMIGVGGGTVMVSAVVLLTGLGQHTAQGTSLPAMAPAGAYTHWRLGNFVLRVVPLFTPGILLGTYPGATLANRLPDETLRILFPLLLGWTGVRNLKTKEKAELTR